MIKLVNYYTSVIFSFCTTLFIVNRPYKNCKLFVNRCHHGLLFECAERAEKKRGKCLFAKHLPRISLIFSIFRLFLDGSLGGSEEFLIL